MNDKLINIIQYLQSILLSEIRYFLPSLFFDRHTFETETYLTRPLQSQLTVCVFCFGFLKQLVQYFHFQSRLPTYTALILIIPFNL